MHQDFSAYSHKTIYYLFHKVLQITLLFWSILFCTSEVFAQQMTDKPFVVVLDAGHGGHDSGNRGNGYFEKKIALNIVLKIGKQYRQALRQNSPHPQENPIAYPSQKKLLITLQQNHQKNQSPLQFQLTNSPCIIALAFQ